MIHETYNEISAEDIKETSVPKDVNRREFVKILLGLISASQLPKLFQFEARLNTLGLEGDIRNYLLDNLDIPKVWSPDLSRNEAINRKYRSPSEILEDAITRSKSQVFFDNHNPLIVDNGDLQNLSVEVAKVVSREGVFRVSALNEAMNSSELASPLNKLKDLMWTRQFESYPDLLREMNLQGDNPVWPAFGRALNRLLPNVLGKLKVDSDNFNKGDSKREISQLSDDNLRNVFVRALLVEVEEMKVELENYRKQVEIKTGNEKLSCSEFLNYFIEKNNGDVIRAIMDAYHFTDTVTKTNYDEFLINSHSSDNDYLQGALWLANLVRDEVSLVVPWDYLVKFPELARDVTKVLENKQREDVLDKNEIVMLKNFQLVNRVGGMRHLLSTMLLSACLPTITVSPIMIGHYYGLGVGVKDKIIDGKLDYLLPSEHNLTDGIGEHGYAAFVEAMSDSSLMGHGTIKFSSDTLSALDAGNMKRRMKSSN